MTGGYKKFLAAALSAVLLLPAAQQPVSAEFDHYPYWALQSAYNNAIESGDDDALVEACEGIIELYDGFPDADATYRVEGPALKAAKVYEGRGQYENALRMYCAYRDCLTARLDFTGDDVSERLLFADAFIDSYAYMEPTVYVHANAPYDVPYHGAKNEPKTGTYVGMCQINGDNYDASLNNGYVLYTTFEKETIRSFDYLLPKTNSYYMLEIAWNLADNYAAYGALEYLDRIADGEFDSYIIADLKYLGELENCGVLLRFGAEVNEWNVNTAYYWNGQLEAFKSTYIEAFRHVHDLAEIHAPNAAMVYSPNDISNKYVTHEDFYPGDDYVDWVGMSTYCNLSDEATYEFANMPDAYYRRGVYENQMIKIKDIVDAYGDRKPIVISECGFMYRSASSYQTEEHAKASMEQFYTIVNMLFPQIKAVFYFNANFDGNEYCLFGFGNQSDHPYLASVYTDCVLANPVMADTLAGKRGGYTRLETLCEKRDDLTLSLYAAYPGSPEVTVTYKLDGKVAASEKTMPYTCHLSSELLAEGKHTLKVTTQAGDVSYTKEYVIRVLDNGVIRVGDAVLLGDISGNIAVDIEDALLLFRHTMLPALYPLDYERNLDFSWDGMTDIGDALRLFQYSMLPEMYPIG